MSRSSFRGPVIRAQVSLLEKPLQPESFGGDLNRSGPLAGDVAEVDTGARWPCR
jgi:hypothetical protein